MQCDFECKFKVFLYFILISCNVKWKDCTLFYSVHVFFPHPVTLYSVKSNLISCFRHPISTHLCAVTLFDPQQGGERKGIKRV